MENPRPEKVAVVDEVRERLGSVTGAILTEYRGLSVSELAQLRQALTAAGGDYKIYKNTLVKLAVAGGTHQPLEALLEGPTGIAFVSGEISAVAKALRDYSRSNPLLVIKGGMLGDGLLSTAELAALADLPSRDVLLARLAGSIAAPLQQLAGLLQALPRNLAYGLKALLDQQGGAPAEATAETPVPESVAVVETPEAEGPEAETAAEAPETEAEAPETETETEAEAPETEVAEAPETEVAEAEVASAAPSAEEPTDTDA